MAPSDPRPADSMAMDPYWLDEEFGSDADVEWLEAAEKVYSDPEDLQWAFVEWKAQEREKAEKAATKSVTPPPSTELTAPPTE